MAVAPDSTDAAGFDESFSLMEMFDVVRRRAALLLSVMTLAGIVAAVLTARIEPRYRATSLIRVDNPDVEIADLASVVSGLPSGPEAIEGEIAVLRSPKLAKEVIAELGLHRSPEFNAHFDPRSGSRGSHVETVGASETVDAEPAERRDTAADAQVAGSAREVSDDGDFVLDPSSTASEVGRGRPPNVDRAQWVSIVNNFANRLKVSRVGSSPVISVTFTSLDPVTAANAANGLADAYIRAQIASKVETTRRATALLRERIESVRREVEISETEVERFRRDHDLVGSGELDLVAQQLLELNAEIVKLSGERSEVEARLEQARNRLTGSGTPGDRQPVQAIHPSAAGTRRAPRQDWASSIEPAYVQLKTKAELLSIVNDIEHEAAVVRGRQAALEGNLRRLKQQLAETKQNQVRLRALEREAEANRALFETLLIRVRETSFQEELGELHAEAQIVSRADVPVSPSSPKTEFMVALVVIGAGLFAVAYAFLIEVNESGFRSGEEVRRALGGTFLGLHPASSSSRRLRSHQPCTDLILTKPRAAFVVALNNLYWSIQLQSGLGQVPRTILFASAEPEEGKTTIAFGLGRIQALAGRSVLLVDGDLRKPDLHQAAGAAREPGLTDLLAGNANLPETIAVDTPTGMHIIPAGSKSDSASALLASDAMDSLLRTLGGMYDCIIIDSPPVRAVMDASILARKTDLTIFVVRWRHTRRPVVAQAVRQLALPPEKRPGIVLSRVDTKRHARYRFGDSGCYSGELENYGMA